jgi:hypothetical protein
MRKIVSKNHRTTAAQVTGQQNWIFILKTLFTLKLSEVSFTNPTFTLQLQLLNLWLLKVMLRCVNDGVTTIKPGHQTTWNECVIPSDESSFTLFPTWGRVYVWRTPKEAYNPECLVSTTRGRFCDGLGSNIVVKYSIGPIITFHGRIIAREYVDRLGNQVYPMIQTFFPNNDAVLEEVYSWNCSVMVRRAWRWTSTSSLATIFSRSEHHWTTLVSFGD